MISYCIIFILSFGIVTFNYDCARWDSRKYHWLKSLDTHNNKYAWYICRCEIGQSIAAKEHKTYNKCESILVTTKMYSNRTEMTKFEWIFVVVVALHTRKIHKPICWRCLAIVSYAIHLWCHSFNISRWFQFQSIPNYFVLCTGTQAINKFYLCIYLFYF